MNVLVKNKRQRKKTRMYWRITGGSLENVNVLMNNKIKRENQECMKEKQNALMKNRRAKRY